MADIADYFPAEWPASAKDEIVDLFERARREGLWFFHGGLTGPLWFSPSELEAQLASGNFRWGAINWRLRDPVEWLHEIDMQRKEITDRWLSVRHRIDAELRAQVQTERAKA